MAKESIASNPEKVKPAFEPSVERRAEYQAVYDRLILRGKTRTYVRGVHHRHHILPKCMGGSNERSNLSILTYREHFLAHWLLSKIVDKTFRYQMLNAIQRMMCKTKGQPESFAGWQYALAQRAASMATSTRMVGNRYALGCKHTPEQRAQNSARLKNNPRVIASRMGNKNAMGKRTAAFCELMRNYARGNTNLAKTIICLNDDKIYTSAKAAAEAYALNWNCVARVARGERNHTRGYRFEYV